MPGISMSVSTTSNAKPERGAVRLSWASGAMLQKMEQSSTNSINCVHCRPHLLTVEHDVVRLGAWRFIARPRMPSWWRR
jgi:hypothetical protein